MTLYHISDCVETCSENGGVCVPSGSSFFCQPPVNAECPDKCYFGENCEKCKLSKITIYFHNSVTGSLSQIEKIVSINQL